MKLSDNEIKLIRSHLVNIVASKTSLESFDLFLFGSRATDSGDERSDIDVGIVAKRPLTISEMARIRETIEEIRTLYKIDFVDFSRVSPSFKETALKEAISLNLTN